MTDKYEDEKLDKEIDENNKNGHFFDDLDEEENESEEDEDEHLKDLSALQLLNFGKYEFRHQKNYQKSSDLFSRAVEKRKLELNIEDDIDYRLAVYYLWYGDSLLTKEEETKDIFDIVKEQKPNELEKAEAEETDEITDEQLAFEILELSRSCFEKGNQKGEIITKLEANNWSIVHTRLGDMELMNNQFEEALKDYQEVVNIRQKFNFSEEALIDSKISLAQAKLFNGQISESLDDFKKILVTIYKVINGELNLPNNVCMEKIKETEEDIVIQINELNKQLNETTIPTSSNEKGSQSNAKRYVPTTTTTFDTPSLNEKNTHTHITIIPTCEDSHKHTSSKTQDIEKQPKARRIDLSNYSTTTT